MTARLDYPSSSHEASTERIDFRPSPLDLHLYLPWACDQMQCEYTVTVLKITQAEYVSVAAAAKKQKVKPKKSLSAHSKSDDVNDLVMAEEAIKIYAVYDSCDNLVQLKFLKNQYIPRLIFQILGLIIKFQKYLNTIIINRGLDIYSVHEINKFLPVSYVTDLIFDNTYLKAGNYSTLLENVNTIKRLSLARCKINDDAVETIAAKLVYPMPASKTLVILDLSTNKITDTGAKHIALALRTNRCLSYLNLSDNALTDVGGEVILDCLTNFALTTEELVSSKQRLLNYYKLRNELVTQNIEQLRVIDQSKSKRKSLKSGTPKRTGERKSLEKVSEPRETKSLLELDAIVYEKACAIVDNQMGKYKDPFTKDNLVTKDGTVYCLGNNTLCYLNLSYNNLTYISLKKIYKIVTTQKAANRKPLGLINIPVSGNYMPISCLEMVKIDDMLSAIIPAEKNPNTKKRSPSKAAP